MPRAIWARLLRAPALVGLMLLWAAACAPAPSPAAPASAPPGQSRRRGPRRPVRPRPPAPPLPGTRWWLPPGRRASWSSPRPRGSSGASPSRASSRTTPASGWSTGGNSRDFWPRLFQERDAGQYLWDLRVGGPDPEVFDARDRGALDPVRPLLVLPEVADESKWFGGFDGMYADKAKEYLPAFVASAAFNVYVNRNAVPESDLTAEEQLVDPRWRGKIVAARPSRGAGLGTTTTQLAAFGEDYVRQLFTQQDVVVTGDNRQQAEWVVRNRYPIGIGLRMDQVRTFELQGLPVNVKGLGTPRKLSLGSGGIQLISQRPHPNAAQVFVNWLLTQPVQESYRQGRRGEQSPSGRGARRPRRNPRAESPGRLRPPPVRRAAPYPPPCPTARR